ncbi:uncharacterized protein K452DRAFT_58432 [Aplosporella prunicola CBS 121167]|uniref:Uncharacterized protein n=1 Tax=Aplosporella prunicola CBS 121167 TaxID=1176127 RepID=A0A6A6BBT9_9PEZI|nr:uncharacterized protein K452DRAFT_58432 [Aplosporella prunicola CBS 121167]KAF2139941.1 hypothetical protein K452DRAFT_58432 [Aplosporella prunicola CBS 121167]
MLALSPSRSRNSRARAANGRDPESYVPPRPIRVYTGSEEELGVRGSPHIGISIDPDEPELHPDIDPEKEAAVAVKPPPPAYGLWRESVRVDPNLMHWQAVNWSERPQDAANTATAAPHRRSAPVFSPTAGPPVATPHLHPEMVEGSTRPPSYVSDDGVRYVGEAAVQARLGVPPAQFMATMSPPRPPPPPRTPVNQIDPSTPVLQFSPMTPVAQRGPVTPVAQMGPVTPVAQIGHAMPMQHQWSPMPASALYSPIPSVQYSPMPPTPPVFSPMPPAQFAATMSPRRPVFRSVVPRVPPVIVTEAPPQQQPQMMERSSDSSFVTASAGEHTPSFMGDVHPGYRWMVMPGGRGEYS